MGWLDYSRELFAFTIAILVIGSFVYFFWHALSTKPDMNTAKEVTALFGGYVAAVLVYYFGQKQAQSLTNQAVEAKTDYEVLLQKVQTAKTLAFTLMEDRDKLLNKLEEYEEKLKRLENDP